MPNKPQQNPKQKLNLKNETCLLTYCKVFNNKNKQVGSGFTLTRSNGVDVPVLVNNKGEELEPGDYSVRHGDEDRLVVVSWVVQ